jgi:replicative DNA helicase
MIFDEVKRKIDDGIAGLNEGIPMGFPRLNKLIPGVQRGTYYLIGGELGTGKSAFVDEAFVYNPYEYILNAETKPDFQILYFSLEIDKVRKIAKAIARRIFHKYKVLIDINYVLSRGKNRISDEIYQQVLSECDYFYKLEEYVTFYDRPINPTGIWKDVLNYSKENGVWQDAKDAEGQFIPAEYKPHNPNKTVVIIVDHVGLMRLERGFNKKQNIDKFSEYCIILRNKCGYSPVLIQQLNRSMSSSERFSANRVEPQLSDYKDSGNTQDDGDIVLAVFNPTRYDIKNFYGYNTSLLKNRFRSLSILKSRDGDADQILGMGFIGQTGTFFELPQSNIMQNSDYEKIIKL